MCESCNKYARNSSCYEINENRRNKLTRTGLHETYLVNKMEYVHIAITNSAWSDLSVDRNVVIVELMKMFDIPVVRVGKRL